MKPDDELIPTRRSLLTRLKHWDDQEGWKQFYDTYWKLIYNAAILSGLSDADAQDVVQDTVIAVTKKMGKFKYDPALGSFKGWLLHLTRWRIADQWRKRGDVFVASGSAPDETSRTAMIERAPDPKSLNLDAVWEEEWQQNLLDAALERVKRKAGAKQFQLFDLYVTKQWLVEDIVKTMEVSVHQVYQAGSRVSALVRKEVKQLERTYI